MTSNSLSPNSNATISVQSNNNSTIFRGKKTFVFFSFKIFSSFPTKERFLTFFFLGFAELSVLQIQNNKNSIEKGKVYVYSKGDSNFQLVFPSGTIGNENLICIPEVYGAASPDVIENNLKRHGFKATWYSFNFGTDQEIRENLKEAYKVKLETIQGKNSIFTC